MYMQPTSEYQVQHEHNGHLSQHITDTFQVWKTSVEDLF